MNRFGALVTSDKLWPYICRRRQGENEAINDGFGCYQETYENITNSFFRMFAELEEEGLEITQDHVQEELESKFDYIMD